MGTPRPCPVSSKLQRIAELAREDPNRVLTSLAHHIDIAFLREAFRRTGKGGATGVDKVTATEYGQDLEGNLQSLLDRFDQGTLDRGAVCQDRPKAPWIEAPSAKTNLWPPAHQDTPTTVG